MEEELLSQHLDTCVTTAILGEDHRERERVIGEVMDVFKWTSSDLGYTCGKVYSVALTQEMKGGVASGSI